MAPKVVYDFLQYDIRIWPEIYQRQMLEASQKPSEDGNPSDSIPLIREIKRRYREFMYLHNRLTHSQMSGCMKNVLRPNRRYGMPFGRMDPDVIEGRRKILETYLVVSLCFYILSWRRFYLFVSPYFLGTCLSSLFRTWI